MRKRIDKEKRLKYNQLTKTQERRPHEVFNKNLFRAKAIERGLTLARIASDIGIKESTLWRKMTGISDFSRKEICNIIRVLDLTSEDVDNIFFADKLA